MKIEFTVCGQPVGKERPRKGKRGFYTPPKTKNFEALVALTCTTHLRIQQFFLPLFRSGFLCVSLELFFKKGKGRLPDIDNAAKSILDGLNAIAYHDDSQVKELHVYLNYVIDNPYCKIRIEEIKTCAH